MLAGVLASSTVFFGTFGLLRESMQRSNGGAPLSAVQTALAGAATGAISSFVMNPFEVIKACGCDGCAVTSAE